MLTGRGNYAFLWTDSWHFYCACRHFRELLCLSLFCLTPALANWLNHCRIFCCSCCCCFFFPSVNFWSFLATDRLLSLGGFSALLTQIRKNEVDFNASFGTCRNARREKDESFSFNSKPTVYFVDIQDGKTGNFLWRNHGFHLLLSLN